MKFAKLFLTLTAVVMCATGFTACGNSQEENASTADVQNAQADVSKDVVEIADKLKSDIAFVDTLNELSPEMTEKLLGVKQEWYSAGKVYVGSGGATAEEIACFEAVDGDSAGNVKSALDSRVEAQKKAFENYQPKEMDKLNDPVIVVEGNYVFMCISDDNETAKEIIG